jgi:LCP family protein required for cell wall assembly
MQLTRSRFRTKSTLWIPLALVLIAWAMSQKPAPTTSVMAATGEPTPSGTAIAASTATATLTPLPSPSATATLSSTATDTATWTASPTASAAATATATPSPTLTATATETTTPLPTPTNTATATLRPSPLPTTSLPATTTVTVTVTADASPTPAGSPTPVATVAFDQDTVRILLIGGDSSSMWDTNTDTLIVAVLNKKTRQVSMLSIPRDLWVYIPTYGWGRINMAQRIGSSHKYPEGGGPGLLMQTLKDNLGITVDHWAWIGYDGFARAVDQVGGVDMIVPCRVNLRYKPPTSDTETEMILEAGYQHLDGATALRYVRTRRDETDFERESRQQQFLKEVWHQFRSASTILKIPQLWSDLKGSFATDLSLGDVLGLTPTILDLQPQHIRSLYIGRAQVQNWTTPGGARVLLPIPEKVQEVVANLYAPPPPSDGAPKEIARVQVQNGTGRRDLAAIAADQLRWYGIDAVDAGPADRANYTRTQIVVLADKPGTLQVLASVLKVKPQDVVQSNEPASGADIRVILGADYDPCH